MVIANPAASAFTGTEFRRVCRILGERYDVEGHWPESPLITHQLALEAASRGVGAVFAMGGDGVVHHAAQGIVGSSVPLGIIPSGTTNVLARILGIPGRPIPAARHLLGASPRPMAAIRTEMEQENGDVVLDHALFALGFGFDADVVERAEVAAHRKRTLGGGHYAISTLAQLWGYRGKRPHGIVRAGRESIDAVAAQVQVHDVYTYFGRIPLKAGPRSEGSLTVTTYSRLGPTVIPGLAIGAATGTRMPRVRGARVLTEVSDLRITALDEPLHAQADGEPLGRIHTVRITHSAGAYFALA